MNSDEYLPRCQYMVGRGAQKKQCPNRTIRQGIRFCPEHRCVYRDHYDQQCENGIHHNLQCSAHQCRVVGCELIAQAPSSYCQSDHVKESCRYEDEYGTMCPKDPVGASDYCSKRHRYKARQVRKVLDHTAPVSDSPMIPSWESDPNVNPKCQCKTSFGLPIHHYIGQC